MVASLSLGQVTVFATAAVCRTHAVLNLKAGPLK
jgi:hypothetical protein